MKYQGVVTDQSWHASLIEKYPDRRAGSEDSFKRRAESQSKQDIRELAQASTKTEARKYYAS